MNSLSNHPQARSRTISALWWLLVAIALAVAMSILLTGCAGKDGVNHPNRDDWEAFKDAL